MEYYASTYLVLSKQIEIIDDEGSVNIHDIYIYTYISLLKGQRQFPRISSSVDDRMIQSCEECYRNETNILLSCVFAQCTLHAHNETSICLIMEQTRNIDITRFS